MLRGLGFLKKYGVEFNTLTTIHNENSRHPLFIYRFLKEVGSGYMQFIPIVERVAFKPSEDGLVLIGPAHPREARVSDVGRYFVQIFGVALESWLGLDQSLCVFRPTCGTAMAMEHNGDLYSCDYVVYPENKLGNIIEQPLQTLVNSEQQPKFGRDKHDTLPGYCRKCAVRFACNGECPKHRFVRTPDGEEGLNYLCAGYKLFFKHIDPFMKFMANELRHQRPPANVMDWVRLRDRTAAGNKSPGRNDPCPCDSGKKFKKCCGRGI